jgi:uncharacterized protein (DUF3820 family)
VAPKNSARATYLIYDKSNRSRTAELGLRLGKVDKSTLDIWKTQFEGGNPKVTQEVLEGQVTVTLTEISGKYTCDRLLDGPTDYLIWLASFEAPDGKTYHIKVQGNAEIVRPSREPFLRLLKSLEK